MAMVYARKWASELPDRCQLCAMRLEDNDWVDGKTERGSWAHMCLRCHEEYGYGLGTGCGQRWNKDGWWVKG